VNKLFSLRTLLALSAAVLVLTTTAIGRSPGDTEAAGPHIVIYTMASQSEGSPLQWCTGLYNPPVHPPNRSIDVFGDSTVTPCMGDISSQSRLRTWGFGGTSNHLTLRAYASGGVSSMGCDIVNIGMIDVANGLHGQLQWLHTGRSLGDGVAANVYAGPYPGYQSTTTIGFTTVDNDGGCSWVGYHVHQGTLVDCMVVNSSMSGTTIYNVWDVDRYLHEIDYAEGLALCDG
jgi:hypothetical protein